MTHGRRLEYLEAMGIELWVPRRPPWGGAAGPVSELAPAPGPGDDGTPAPPAVAFADLDWAALEARVRGCTACALAEGRARTVFGVGDRQAEWMLVGEAPGAEEDRQGLPFVGRAGQLLTAMLRALGFTREQVYIANILKCRPPGNRDPRPEEVACCEGYLQRQIDLVRPRILLALGRIAAQNLLKVESPLKNLRGRVHRYGPASTPLVVTYHPAYLLRNPADKRRAWEDLQFATRVLGQRHERGLG